MKNSPHSKSKKLVKIFEIKFTARTILKRLDSFDRIKSKKMNRGSNSLNNFIFNSSTNFNLIFKKISSLTGKMEQTRNRKCTTNLFTVFFSNIRIRYRNYRKQKKILYFTSRNDSDDFETVMKHSVFWIRINSIDNLVIMFISRINSEKKY